MRAIDLFCGAGGFSHGAHLAGIDVISAYDIDPILTSSFQHNFPGTSLNLVDLSQISGAEILTSANGPIDCIFGGPPCQGFSSIGKRDVRDPRRKLIRHFFRIVSEASPDFFVMENVLGLAQSDARNSLLEALKLVSDKYEILGPIVLDASNFGAATSRKRVFLIGQRTPGYITLSSSMFKNATPATVEDAISDLMTASYIYTSADGFDTWELRPGSLIPEYARRLRSENLIFTSNQRTTHSPAVEKRFSALKQGEIDRIGRHPRLAWAGQCPTLRAGTGSDRGSFQSVRPVHPSEPRVITVREAARLQGFPDCHRFHPTLWHSFRMIGNSVSPFVAKAIFEALKSATRVNTDRSADDSRATA